MIFDDIEVGVGESKMIDFKVGNLPSGDPLHVSAHVFRGKLEGPTIGVFGGIHGDELNGIEIVRKALSVGVFSRLEAGAVIACPLVNIPGFIHASRDMPDGKDVNRSFPGTMKGSMASRVARTLYTHIISKIDICIDFHTGGKSLFNHPQVRYTAADKNSLELSKTFGAPLIIESKLIPKSLRKECHKKGIPTLVYEGGESLRVDLPSIEIGLNGLNNILIHLGMKKGDQNTVESTYLAVHKWIRANHAGLFIQQVKPGDHVEKNQVLGIIADPNNFKMTKVKAPYAGCVFGLNNKSIVNTGEALIHIGK